MDIKFDVTRGYTKEELQEEITVTREELFAFEDDIDMVTMEWRPAAKRIGDFTKNKR